MRNILSHCQIERAREEVQSLAALINRRDGIVIEKNLGSSAIVLG